MARTPLMRALQELAREHSAAKAQGIGVSELREREAEASYSRRELLRRGGAIGAAVAVAGPAAFARPARAATTPKIAIVGGGIAGLACALALHDKGVASDVYEASSRVGGRMHSDWIEFGQTFWDNDPVWLAQNRSGLDSLTIWLDAGTEDVWLPNIEAVHAALVDEGLHPIWHIYPGPHEAEYWIEHVPDYLHFYGGALRT